MRSIKSKLEAKSRIPLAESNRGATRPPTVHFDASKELGAIPPLGYFDPLGIARGWNRAGFRFLRAAELKHGRAAMLASIGFLVQHYIRLPGFEDVPAGVGALGTDMGKYGMAALVVFCGFIELFVWQQEENEPGNFMWDPLGLNMYDADMRNKEISNGRMAMISVAGIVGAELATGKDAIEQLGIAGPLESPLAPATVVAHTAGKIGAMAATVCPALQEVEETLAGKSAEVAAVGHAAGYVADTAVGGHGAVVGVVAHASKNLSDAPDLLASITAAVDHIATVHPEKLAAVAEALAQITTVNHGR